MSWAPRGKGNWFTRRPYRSFDGFDGFDAPGDASKCNKCCDSFSAGRFAPSPANGTSAIQRHHTPPISTFQNKKTNVPFTCFDIFFQVSTPEWNRVDKAENGRDLFMKASNPFNSVGCVWNLNTPWPCQRKTPLTGCTFHLKIQCWDDETKRLNDGVIEPAILLRRNW